MIFTYRFIAVLTNMRITYTTFPLLIEEPPAVTHGALTGGDRTGWFYALHITSVSDIINDTVDIFDSLDECLFLGYQLTTELLTSPVSEFYIHVGLAPG